MLDMKIPGYHHLQLRHMVLDFNGTLACDGELMEGVASRLMSLSETMSIHVVTADTFGNVRSAMENVPVTVTVLPAEGQTVAKGDYISRLSAPSTVCIGNGRNDQLMLKRAALGIAVIQEEGAAMECLSAADIVCTNICQALDLLLHPLRLTATLRS